MNASTLYNAIETAERFHEAASILLSKSMSDDDVFSGCKESATVRRASMDLTRALAELRKPN